MVQKPLLILVLMAASLLQVQPAPLQGFALEPAGLVSESITPPLESIISPMTADLNDDGIPENLILQNGVLAIQSESKMTWQSSPDWQVIQADFTDLNRDGIPEVTLLLWRPFKPWLVDQWLPFGGRISEFHDSSGQSCHIILMGWKGDGYHELWAGSPMADPISSFITADLNGDGHQELVVLEGKYSSSRHAPARTLKVWEWNGFGFSAVSFMNGTFTSLALVSTNDDKILILVP